MKSLRQCQSLDEVYRLADDGQHDRVINLLLPLFDGDKLFDISDGYARSLLLVESLLSVNNYEVIASNSGDNISNNHHNILYAQPVGY